MPMGRIFALVGVLAGVGVVVPLSGLRGQSSAPPRQVPAPEVPVREMGLVLDNNCTSDPPGFRVFWETDAETLKDRLLAGLPPVGVTITGWSITPDPNDISENETIGYYEDFDVTDGSNRLTVPDGVVLTTGRFVDVAGNHANYCNDDGIFTCVGSGDPGDDDVAGMYRQDIRPEVYDGTSLSLTFTSDASIGGLRFKVLLASDEFSFFAAPAPIPADPKQQNEVVCFPDTFGAFLNRDAFGFTRDLQGDEVLTNVAEQVINLNNNTSQTGDEADKWTVDNRCAELAATSYTNVDFNIEYDGIAARQVSPGNWEPLTLSLALAPSEPGHPHVLKLAISDVTDDILDTAAFLSELEFIECYCPPQDSDGDGDVDVNDYGRFQLCYNGANRPYASSDDACFCFDSDHDNDVDIGDYAAFQVCFNGSGRPPACDTSWCGSEDRGAAAEPASTVVFDLLSAQAGQRVRRGQALEWLAVADVRGAQLAAFAFDMELRRGGADGPRADVRLSPQVKTVMMSDAASPWRRVGPDGHRPGLLAGIGDALAVPGSGVGGAASGVVTSGTVDTSGLAPGRYVLRLDPRAATVVRVNVEAAAGGDFAGPAAVQVGSACVEFDVASD